MPAGPMPPPARGDKRPLLVATDSRGRLKSWPLLLREPYWRGGVALVTHATPARYLKLIQDAGAEAIIAGLKRVDLREALDQLRGRYRTRVVRVDSGGALSGALLAERLVDELSLLVCPCLAGGGRPGPSPARKRSWEGSTCRLSSSPARSWSADMSGCGIRLLSEMPDPALPTVSAEYAQGLVERGKQEIESYWNKHAVGFVLGQLLIIVLLVWLPFNHNRLFGDPYDVVLIVVLGIGGLLYINYKEPRLLKNVHTAVPVINEHLRSILSDCGQLATALGPHAEERMPSIRGNLNRPAWQHELIRFPCPDLSTPEGRIDALIKNYIKCCRDRGLKPYPQALYAAAGITENRINPDRPDMYPLRGLTDALLKIQVGELLLEGLKPLGDNTSSSEPDRS